MHIQSIYDRSTKFWGSWYFGLHPHCLWREIKSPFFMDWWRLMIGFGFAYRHITVCLVIGRKCKNKGHDWKLLKKKISGRAAA